jgi:hypothetical protein
MPVSDSHGVHLRQCNLAFYSDVYSVDVTVDLLAVVDDNERSKTHREREETLTFSF